MGRPDVWSVYLATDDAGKTLDTATAGGQVHVQAMAAEDTPYGRLAAATDPTGVQFKLVAPNAAMPARSTSN